MVGLRSAGPTISLYGFYVQLSIGFEGKQVAAIRELIAQEVDLRWAAGQSAEAEEYHQRFPQYPQAVNFEVARFLRRSS